MKEYVVSEETMITSLGNLIEGSTEDTVFHVNVDSLRNTIWEYSIGVYNDTDHRENLTKLVKITKNTFIQVKLNSIKNKETTTLSDEGTVLVRRNGNSRIYVNLFYIERDVLLDDSLYMDEQYHTEIGNVLEILTGWYSRTRSLPLLVNSLDYGFCFKPITKCILKVDENKVSQENLYDKINPQKNMFELKKSS